MMKEKDIIVVKKGMHRLFEDENGYTYIGVICGGFASYEMKIKLNQDELASYQDSGKDSLDKLAYDIAHHPDSYENRAV